MDVKRICGLGYFDNLFIDGYMMPMYYNKGIQIKRDESLVEALELNDTAYTQGIGKLRINILGESVNKDSYEDILRMRKHREDELKLNRLKLGSIDRYIIGYMDIFILKGDATFPKDVTNTGKTLDDINKLAKGEDELLLLTKALSIQNDLIHKYQDTNKLNIAIVSKVYIYKTFRQCGISTWLHNNIKDLIKLYSMIDIGAVILIPGDFNSEAESEFGMSKQQYENMLIKHYKNVGYKFIDKLIMYKKHIK